MFKSGKPVRKCHGCPLNLGPRCAAFPDPHKQWDSRKCKGYANEALHQEYLDEQASHPADPEREERRRRAKRAKTEPHYDGTLSHRSPLAHRRRSS